jgi:ASC-1-like (ASCH) protein/predicted transcriptional regulator
MEKNERKRIAIISIMTYYAKQIFDETKLYEFRKSPLKKELLDKKIYVYSAKEDKAIIGYFRVSDILNGNTTKILELTGYDKRKDGFEIVDYFGKNNPNCFALHLYDVTEFEEYLTLKDMRKVSNNADMPQYIKFIYENDPLYDVITKWDEAFSLDGNLCESPAKTKQLILQKAIMKGKNNMEHEMKLQPEYFNFILNGTKRIEIRLNDEKRQQIKIGDTIKFLKEPELSENFNAKVTGLLRYNSFDDMFKDFEIEILSDKSMTKEQLKNVLEQFYTKEKQEQYGVLGIRIELI